MIESNGYLVTCDATGLQATVKTRRDIPENWIRALISFEIFTHLNPRHYKIVEEICPAGTRVDYRIQEGAREMHFSSETNAALFLLGLMGFEKSASLFIQDK